MAKRFTATEKWSDRWFRNLSCTLKLGYLYLLDNCDQAGVIEVDEDLANFQIGGQVDWVKLVETSEGRIETLECGKYWITKFIDYQYGALSERCPPHRPVFSSLEKHGLKQRVLKGYSKGTVRYWKKKRIRKGSSLSSSEDDAAAFEEFWKAFPSGRKKKKPVAKEAFQKALSKDGVTSEMLIETAAEYAASPEGQSEFVPMPSSWLNAERWTDDRAAWQRSDNGDHDNSRPYRVDPDGAEHWSCTPPRDVIRDLPPGSTYIEENGSPCEVGRRRS